MKYNSVKRGGAFAFAIILGLLAFAPLAHAQRKNAFSTPVFTGLQVYENTTSNLPTPYFIDCSGSQVITFGTLNTALTYDATNVQIELAPSYDGIHMDTNS